MKTGISIKTFLILVVSFCVSCNNITEQHSANKLEPPTDSRFTNKAEAKNLMVNGLKEGKWMEYMDTNYKVVSDTNAPYYSLTMYKAGKESGISHGYYKSGKLLFETSYNNGKKGVTIEYDEYGKPKYSIIIDSTLLQ